MNRKHSEVAFPKDKLVSMLKAQQARWEGLRERVREEMKKTEQNKYLLGAKDIVGLTAG